MPHRIGSICAAPSAAQGSLADIAGGYLDVPPAQVAIAPTCPFPLQEENRQGEWLVAGGAGGTPDFQTLRSLVFFDHGRKDEIVESLQLRKVPEEKGLVGRHSIEESRKLFVSPALGPEQCQVFFERRAVVLGET